MRLMEYIIDRSNCGLKSCALWLGIPDHDCIDVQGARAIGVRPLPMRVNRGTTYVPDATPVTSEHEENKEIRKAFASMN